MMPACRGHGTWDEGVPGFGCLRIPTSLGGPQGLTLKLELPQAPVSFPAGPGRGWGARGASTVDAANLPGCPLLQQDREGGERGWSRRGGGGGTARTLTPSQALRANHPVPSWWVGRGGGAETIKGQRPGPPAGEDDLLCGPEVSPCPPGRASGPCRKLDVPLALTSGLPPGGGGGGGPHPSCIPDLSPQQRNRS